MSTETTCLSILKFMLCLLLITSIEAYKEIKAYRLIQYETENNLYGSQYSSLNYIGSHYKGDVGRKISLIKFVDFGSLEDIKEFISSQATAFLIILPKKIDINETMQNLLVSLQKYFSEQNFLFPVYFTTETNDINEVYMELKETNGFKETEEAAKGLFGMFEMEGNLLQFSLNASDPKRIDTLTFENFYGYLEGNKGESGTGAGTNPVIAIVGSYDDLSIIPDMPSGLNETSATIIAMYEIIRIVSKFYENYNSFANYDILFLLTSGGQLKNQGLNFFINSLDSASVDNIHFALCLESLSTSNLQLLLNKFPEVTEETPFKFQKALNSTSSSMNVELEYTQSAVEEDASAHRNPHELFTKKNIPSATLTKKHITLSDNTFSKKPLIAKLEKNSLKQTIKLVSETLIAFIFEIENISIFKDDESVIDDNNLNSLIAFFEKYPRTPLNILKESIVNNEILGLMKNYLSKLQRQVFEYKDMKFYDSASGTIKIYSVKSKMIDLYILFLVVIYLLCLYIIIKGPKQFYQSIKAAFTEG